MHAIRDNAIERWRIEALRLGEICAMKLDIGDIEVCDELTDFPEPLRWREWIGRVEAAIFIERGAGVFAAIQNNSRQSLIRWGAAIAGASTDSKGE